MSPDGGAEGGGPGRDVPGDDEATPTAVDPLGPVHRRSIFGGQAIGTLVS